MKNPISWALFYLRSLLLRRRVRWLAIVVVGSTSLRMSNAPSAAENAPLTMADDTSATEQVIRRALSLQGTPYVYGGKTPAGFDCSGFAGYVYRHVGITLPASSRAQFQEGTKVSLEEARRGDLVFFSIYGDRINHVGILLDTVSAKTPFVHATSSRGVRVDYLEQDYYSQRFVGVRTVLDR